MGVLFQIYCTICIFDIYFRSPVVHGMTPVISPSAPPAKRLVLFVADGLRADKLLEEYGETPFLRSVIHEKGAWGLSHTHVPTESRPGHVALISGFYEDVSSVTTGWKSNPVTFDSVFNASRFCWAWGSPDILPMFAKNHEDHVFIDTYDAEDEDFGSDATALDTWVFDHVTEFFKKAEKDLSLKKKLSQDKLVFFLHLLGIDTTGHSKRPYSEAYRNNILLVDKGVEQMYALFESYFNDSGTAYIFTSDHGMSDKGSHGDGERANTETPLLTWGAGIRGPLSAVPSRSYEDIHRKPWTIESPQPWKVNNIRRVDVEQADIAPLMSSLVGIAFPMNSVGVLPIQFLSGDDKWKAENLVSNAKQIFSQVQRKTELLKERTFFFKEYNLLSLKHAVEEISDMDSALKIHQNKYVQQRAWQLIQLSLEALYFYQTYDRTFLLTVSITGYIGWLTYVSMLILKNFTFIASLEIEDPKNWKMVNLSGVGFLLLASVYLFLQHSPIQYYIYFMFPTFFWTQIINNRHIFGRTIQQFLQTPTDKKIETMISLLTCFILLEVMVMGFYTREIFSPCMIGVSIWGFLNRNISFGLKVPWVISTLILAVFPLLPAAAGNITPLVYGGGLLITLFGGLLLYSPLKYLFISPSNQNTHTWFHVRQKIQLVLLVVSSWIVYSTESSLSRHQGLPPLNALLSWCILFYSLGNIIFLPKDIHYLEIVVFVMLSLACPFVLLSISYEVLFYFSLSCVVFTWILIEQQLLMSQLNKNNSKTLQYLHIEDLRIPLFIILFSFHTFFGTGNVASLNSFEIASTYRFFTVFQPFWIMALLILKILLPIFFISIIFNIINRLLSAPPQGQARSIGSFFITVLITNLMGINFFLLIKDTGSWLEIGMSIGHFIGTNAFIVFYFVVFGIAQFVLRNGMSLEKKHFD
uniref:GPI ethanolamine phosphate transferase 1 n=1 Tax=Arcella intermedia TaxID=1963864 RepID=A0A6B2KXJ3_9EUKA